MTGSNLTTKLLGAQLEFARNAFESLGNESQAAFRWIYATLVVLNSGALFLTLSAEMEMNASNRDWAAVCFSVGIFLAVFLAYRTIGRAKEARELIRRYFFHLLHEDCGEKPPETMTFDEAQLVNLLRGESRSVLIGWSSLISFFLGLSIFRVGL